MFASIRPSHVDAAELFRQAAAASSAVLFVTWSVMLMFEMTSSGKWLPNFYSYEQAIVLAVLFSSYAIGWRHELMGAALIIVATAAFFAVSYHSVKVLPPLGAIWFAVPGLLYLLARMCGGRRDATSNCE